MREGWSTGTLAELTNIIKGSSPTLKTPPGDYPLIVTGPEPLSSSTFQLESEAVCVPMVSSTGHGHASLKRVHYASGKFAVANIISACVVKRPHELSTKFLFHYLQHFKDELIVTRMKGTANVSLSVGRLGEVPVSYPPLAEQRRIVDLIAAVDDAIEAAEGEAGRAGDALGYLRNALPDSKMLPIKDVITSIDSGVSVASPAGETKGARMLKISAVRQGRFDDAEFKRTGDAEIPARAQVFEGDLLITRSNTPDRVGFVAIVGELGEPTYMPDLIWRIVPKEERVASSYLEQVLSSPRYRSEIMALGSGTSSSMQKINKAKIGSLLVPVPSLAGQAEYVAPLRAAQDAADAARAEADRLRTLRSNLLTVLLSGEHEIPESYDRFIEEAA